MNPAPCPEHWIEAFDAVAGEALGGVGELLPLATSIAEVSQAYTRARDRIRDVTTTPSGLSARAGFFLPRDLPKVQLPLCELGWVGALPQRECLRVLDLGAGLGATTLGVAELAGRTGFAARLRVDAVDADAAALDLGRGLARLSGPLGGAEVELRTIHAPVDDVAKLAVDDDYDLVVAGNVLNELYPDAAESERIEHLATWLAAAAGRLAAGGVLVVLEPALRAPSRVLQRLRGCFADAGTSPHLFAPCLHSGACPLLERERDWCHQTLRLPMAPTLSARARAAGLSARELRFSYLTLTQAPRSLAELARGGAALRVVSGVLRSKGKRELRLCGEGETRWLRRLDRNASPDNALVESLERGALICLPESPGPQAVRVEVRADTRVERLRG